MYIVQKGQFLFSEQRQ